MYEQKKYTFLRTPEFYLYIRRENLRDLAAGGRQPFLIKRVIDLLSTPFHLHQPGIAQDLKVMRDCRLRDAHLLHDFSHTQLLTAAQRHDLLAGLIRQGFGKIHVTHYGLYYIDNRLFVKRTKIDIFKNTFRVTGLTAL